MNKTHYIFVEDMPWGTVGPFPSRCQAEDHVKEHRYGSSHYEVISYTVAKHLLGRGDFDVTPAEDIAAKLEIPEEDR